MVENKHKLDREGYKTDKMVGKMGLFKLKVNLKVIEAIECYIEALGIQGGLMN